MIHGSLVAILSRRSTHNCENNQNHKYTAEIDRHSIQIVVHQEARMDFVLLILRPYPGHGARRPEVGGVHPRLPQVRAGLRGASAATEGAAR